MTSPHGCGGHQAECRWSSSITWVKGFRACHPKISCFGMITLSRRYGKSSPCKERLYLNSPSLPKDGYPKRVPIVINPLPGGWACASPLKVIYYPLSQLQGSCPHPHIRRYMNSPISRLLWCPLFPPWCLQACSTEN